MSIINQTKKCINNSNSIVNLSWHNNEHLNWTSTLLVPQGHLLLHHDIKTGHGKYNTIQKDKIQENGGGGKHFKWSQVRLNTDRKLQCNYKMIFHFCSRSWKIKKKSIKAAHTTKITGFIKLQQAFSVALIVPLNSQEVESFWLHVTEQLSWEWVVLGLQHCVRAIMQICMRSHAIKKPNK